MMLIMSILLTDCASTEVPEVNQVTKEVVKSNGSAVEVTRALTLFLAFIFLIAGLLLLTGCSDVPGVIALVISIILIITAFNIN